MPKLGILPFYPSLSPLIGRSCMGTLLVDTSANGLEGEMLGRSCMGTLLADTSANGLEGEMGRSCMGTLLVNAFANGLQGGIFTPLFIVPVALSPSLP